MYNYYNNMYDPITLNSLLGADYTHAGTSQQPQSFLGDLSQQWKNLDSFGKLSFGAQSVGGLLGAYNSYNANKLAKKQFNFNRDAFNKQYQAQRKMTNSRLRDRQQGRVEADPNAMSVSEYMAKYGV